MTTTANMNFLERIAELVESGKVALFIGAGVSQAAGAPSTEKLVELIKAKFPKAKFRSDNFMDVCQAVVDSDYYDGPKELPDFVRSILLKPKPSKWHNELPKYKWKAIFTTNFDDLIEQAFRNCQTVPRRDFYPVLTDQFSIMERTTLYIFKLMGTVLARGNDPGKMVLSRKDFIENVKMRTKVSQTLHDIIQDGTVVFIGYSGDDQLVFEIIDEIIKESKEEPSKSYMLLNSLESTEGEEQKLAKRLIIPIQCSFEDLMEFLSKKVDVVKPRPPSDQTVRVAGYDLIFSPEELRIYQSSFRILGEADKNQETGNKDDFFRGINASLGAFREKWDFQRDVYTNAKGIKARVLAELSRKGSRENRVLLISGIPGIGKTMMVQRLAYDCYNEGHPVIIFNKSKGVFDYKILDSMLMDIDRRMAKSSDGKIKTVKSLVLFDNLESLLFDPSEVVTYLTSRGRSALVVCTTREVTFDIGTPFGISSECIFTIPQQLNQNEGERLVDHLVHLGYVASKEVWQDFIQEQLQASFFAAMYTLVDPARRPLGKIIHDQFTKFSSEEKELFMVISAFHRFGLPINIELLTRSALKEDYEKFREILQDSKFRETIVETEDWEGNILYTTHNPIIAQKTLSIFMPDRVRQKDLYCGLLSDVHHAIQVEKDLVERLLIRNLGPNRNLSDLKNDQLLEIFLKVIEKNPTRSLLHHAGILYTKMKDFPKSEKMLLDALKFREKFVEPYRGESTQNILTSIGSMYVEWANEKQLASDTASAEELYKKAEFYLGDAMKSRYPKPHPYHVMARMNLQRGDDNSSDSRKYEFYAKALETIDFGKKNIDKWRARALVELEIKLYDRLRDEKAVASAIEILEKTYSSSKGYYVYAKTLLAGVGSLNSEERKLRLNKADEVIQKGLKTFPGDEYLLKLRTEIVKAQHPGDFKKYFEALDQWFSVSKWQDLTLMFDLAVAAFVLDYYTTAFKVFQQLERKSAGNRDRFVYSQYYLDDKGERRLFDGSIVRIMDPYEGEIRVDSLPNLDRNIRFRTEACKQFVPKENDVVYFHIGFNYVSPECVEVRKK